MGVDEAILSHAQKLVGEIHAQFYDSKYLNSVLQQQQFMIQGHIRTVRILLQSCDFTAQMVGNTCHIALERHICKYAKCVEAVSTTRTSK